MKAPALAERKRPYEAGGGVAVDLFFCKYAPARTQKIPVREGENQNTKRKYDGLDVVEEPPFARHIE